MDMMLGHFIFDLLRLDEFLFEVEDGSSPVLFEDWFEEGNLRSKCFGTG